MYFFKEKPLLLVAWVAFADRTEVGVIVYNHTLVFFQLESDLHY